MDGEVNTTIILVIAGKKGEGKSMMLGLSDEFDTVMNKMFPAQPAGSALEHQQNMKHTLSDGRRVAFNPGIVGVVLEGDHFDGDE